MRSISLVRKLEVDYKGGTIFKNAICLVDIDDDGFNELCIGFTNGEIHAYKGYEEAKPWKMSKGLGSLVVLCGGNFRSPEETLLCSLDSEGRCCFFDAVPYHHDIESSEVTSSSVKSTSRPSSPTNDLRLIHKECLHANAKVAIAEDIDNDGIDELIVGTTDRFVRIYKWHIDDHFDGEFEGSVPLKQPPHTQDKKSPTLPKETKKTSDIPPKSSTQNHDLLASDFVDGFGSPHYHPVGSFTLVKQFSLMGQIGSLAVCQTAEGLNQLIVSQPNGGYCILGQYDQESGFTENISTPTSIDSTLTFGQDSYPTFYPISACSNRSFQNNHINTEVIGGIKRYNKVTGAIGLCTHDGKFIILDNTSGKNPGQNGSNNHWFSMAKVDMTGDGDDEIIICDLNGMTYIIDKERNIVSYNFNDNVAAFCAGFYGNKNGRKSPCLCYVTLSGKLRLYYDVWIDAMKVRCIHSELIEKVKSKPELHYILDVFKTPNGDIDHQKLQNFVKNSWTLSQSKT